MNTLQTPDYGEPWTSIVDRIYCRLPSMVAEFLTEREKERAISCVNAMAGVPDPATAMARLAQLEWVPVTDRLPKREDANYFEDVEWCDGKDIWQGNYKDDDTATHWRSITLP